MKGIMLTNFNNRISMLEYVNNKFIDGIGVEIGVAAGHFSKQIIETWKTCKEFYCVDLWEKQEKDYHDGCNMSNDKQNATYQQILKDFAPFPKVKIIKNWSHEAVKHFQDQFFDFIYIDANHSYKASLEDMKMWYPKLKHGGIMAGHDYLDGPDESYGVKKAANEFAAANKIKLFHTTEEQSPANALWPGSWEGISWLVGK